LVKKKSGELALGQELGRGSRLREEVERRGNEKLIHDWRLLQIVICASYGD